MGYTLWLKIENDDGSPFDPDEGWRALAEDITRSKAVELGDAVAQLVASQGEIAGVVMDILPGPLDGWYSEDGRGMSHPTWCVVSEAHSDGDCRAGATGPTVDELLTEAVDYYREDLRYRLNNHPDDFGDNDSRHAAWIKVDRLDALYASRTKGA